MQDLNILLRYIKYLQQARNKYDIHPPFVYELIAGVFEDTTSFEEYTRVESLKRRLLKDHEMVEVTDLGAGSRTDKNRKRSIKSITRHSSKPQKFGRLLYRMARHFQPSTILELGTAMGISTAYLALGSQGSAVTTIEGCPNIAKKAGQNFESLGLTNVTIINGGFDQVLPAYLAGIESLDLAFIDGNHREEPTINYFEQCLLKRVNSSCFILDDIHWSEGMENAWNHVVNHPEVTLSIDLFFSGLVFFRKELSKQHFTIRF